jgi:catechol 2,3-dioxygenase-like lactoylglutathione lyase family enzyme
MRLRTLLFVFAMLAGLASGPALAQANPQPGPNTIFGPDAKTPIDIRRTTIIVADIDRSLKLYRDALGMSVNYDATMTVSGAAFTQGGKPRPIRLVLLNANDPWIGWIGLLQYTDGKKMKPPKRDALGLGSHVIVTAVKDAEKACTAAQTAPGVKIMAPLKLQEYPGRNGGPTLKVSGCQLFDADGAYLELNQRVQ